MKKIGIMITILFLFVMGVMGYYFLESKKHVEITLYEYSNNIVDIVNNIAKANIKINDVLITNIRIENNEFLNFNISSSKTTLEDKNLDIILYNDYAVNSGTILNYDLNVIKNMKKNKDYYEMKINIKNIYNNPSRIEIKFS